MAVKSVMDKSKRNCARRRVLYFFRMAQQRSFRQRNRRRPRAWSRRKIWFGLVLANRDMDPLYYALFINGGRAVKP